MRQLLLIFALSVFAGSLQAQEDQVSYARSVTKYGGAFTIGDSLAIDNLGYGLTTMTYRFFDPFTPSGFYYGFGGLDIVHTVGGVSIGDLRPFTIGWRKEAAGPLGFDVSFSPVLGSRIIGDTIYGRLYLGIKPMGGIFLAINENIDVELAYEPVIHVVNFSGEDVRNKTYHDISLYLMVKHLSRVRDLGWHSTAR